MSTALIVVLIVFITICMASSCFMFYTTVRDDIRAERKRKKQMHKEDK